MQRMRRNGHDRSDPQDTHALQKPARYLGGEYNQIVKRKQDIDVRVAFCFPDTYEIGMSNIGMRILYGVMNEMDGVWCERCSPPGATWRRRCARTGCRSGRWRATTLSAILTLIAFTLGYEMSYTERPEYARAFRTAAAGQRPRGLEGIVFAGGVCTVNPEPLADFIDFFSIGEGRRAPARSSNATARRSGQGLEAGIFARGGENSRASTCPSLYTHSSQLPTAPLRPLRRAQARRSGSQNASWRI